MTNKQRRELLKIYKRQIRDFHGVAERAPADRPPESHAEALNHALWMLEQMPEFLRQKRIEKFDRWLCFIQGVLWMTEKFTITQMRGHYRSQCSVAATR